MCAHLLWVEIGYRPVSFLPLALPPPEGRRLDSSSAEKSVAGLGRVRCDWGVVFFATPMIPAGRAGIDCASSSRLDLRPLFAAASSMDIGVTLFIVGAHSSSRRTFAGGLDDVLPDVPVNPVLISSAGDVDSDAVEGALIGALRMTTPASPQLISSSTSALSLVSVSSACSLTI